MNFTKSLACRSLDIGGKIACNYSPFLSDKESNLISFTPKGNQELRRLTSVPKYGCRESMEQILGTLVMLDPEKLSWN